jgi:hypothetical protein
MGFLCCFSNARSRTTGAQPEPNVAAVPLTSLSSPQTADRLTDASAASFSDPVTSDSQQLNDPLPPSDQITETADQGMSEIGYKLTNFTETKEFPTDSPLGKAVAEFRKNYLKFTQNNSRYISNVNEDVEKAMAQATSGRDIKAASKIFEEQIAAVVQARQKKQDIHQAKWTGKVGGFLKTMYPVALMSLKLASSAGEVNTNVDQV